MTIKKLKSNAEYRPKCRFCDAEAKWKTQWTTERWYACSEHRDKLAEYETNRGQDRSDCMSMADEMTWGRL